MRTLAAYDIAALMGMAISACMEACERVVMEKLPALSAAAAA